MLALAILLLALVALRFILRWLIRWLAALWLHGPAIVRRGAELIPGQQLGRRFKARFPRTTAFVGARLNPRVFTGLPLTLIALAGAYAVILFGGLVEAVMESDEIRSFDSRIASWIEPLRSDELVAIFRWITELGAMPTLTAVAIVASGFMIAHGPRRYVLPLWLTVAGSQITTYSGKYIFDRPRPEFILDVTAATPSFPSGHTTGAMAVYGIIAYAILRDVTSQRARFDIAYWTGVLILLIGFSRIFLGVHFASDVAAGLLVGGFWLLAGVTVAELKRPS
jgi:membrane-associated phospholipid phosphatase